MNKPQEVLVRIKADSVTLEGALCVPEVAKGIVLFAHGSGSSRHSPRNNAVAAVLRANGLATLLMDLLTVEEDKNYDNRFDVKMLAARLVVATNWLKADRRTAGLNIGYFGASTGAGAAIVASVMAGEGMIKAIVSRGGRPDLAKEYLPVVLPPTLLIVGGNDIVVVETNVLAYKPLTCVKEMVIIPGATHLFEEPGTLEAAASHAVRWFKRYLE